MDDSLCQCGIDRVVVRDESDACVSVLFIVDGWFPTIGGAEIQALRLAGSLRSRGVRVEFVTPWLDRNKVVDEIVDGFRIRRLSYPRIKLLGALYLNLKLFLLVLRERRRFDCIHVHITSVMAATVGYARRWLDIPVITKISGFYEFEHGVLSQRPSLNVLQWVIRRGLRHIDYVQCISQQTRERLLVAGFTSAQIRYIPNGIRLTVEPARPVAAVGAPFRIGYCGRLQPVKGVDVLIRGFAGAVRHMGDRRPLELVIVGDGEALESLQRLTRELHMSGHVRFVGVLKDTSPLLSTFGLYVQPSYAEGLPNAVLEAMNHALPVIATDIGGNQDLIEPGRNGWLFPAGDSESLTRTLVEALSDPALMTAFGRTSHSIVAERFGFDSVTDQLMELYRGR